MNRRTHFNLQQNNFNFISFSYTWIPYNKNTAEFWRVLDIFILWLIINTNMNTSYTINTALSKGVESITRHHSPLTTEYISIQHIYKSYSEREKQRKKKQRWGVTRGKEKVQVLLHGLNQKPWFFLKKVNQSIYLRWINNSFWGGLEAKLLMKMYLIPFGKPDLVHTADWQ